MTAVFLSESVPDGRAVWNPSYWSPVYEVWFYTIFAAGHFLEGRKRILWLVLPSLAGGWRILLMMPMMMPIWLLGAGLAPDSGATAG